MQTYLFDIAKRLIKWDKKLEIYKNGSDNAYIERTDRLVNNSVTAKMSVGLMVQYLLGKGFGENDDFIINTETGQTLIEFAEELCDSIVLNRGAAIHFNYKIQPNEKGNTIYKPVNPSVVPFNTARLGKKDSRKYNGKILLYDNWSDEKIKIEHVSVYDVFNDNNAVVESQIKQAKGIQKYKGQILYINYDKKYYYPLSRIDSVMNDCDSEAQASVYKNQLLRNGFFGKTIVITRPLIDSDIDEYIPDEKGDLIPNSEYREAFTEAEETKKTIESFLGAEEAGGAMLMQMDNDGDKFEDSILIKQIESKIDDKMFEFTENSVSKNILMAFCNIPVSLVKSPDSALLGNSGEAMKEAKRTYWENTEKERSKFLKIIRFVLSTLGRKDEVNITPLLTEITTDYASNNTTNKSATTTAT